MLVAASKAMTIRSSWGVKWTEVRRGRTRLGTIRLHSAQQAPLNPPSISPSFASLHTPRSDALHRAANVPPSDSRESAAASRHDHPPPPSLLRLRAASAFSPPPSL
eukprot:scaffold101463_cov75-Phaeocystis_antarctica.AAC.7